MDITLYSAFWCGDCREAKRFLQRHNIPYKEVDIESTPGAAEAVIQQTGKRAIPQLVIMVSGFSPTDQGKAFCTKRCLSGSESIRHN
jgi:mycoredoxin